MSTPFHLEILTPERHFFNGEVEAITVNAPNGQITILANHAPLIVPLSTAGEIRIKQNGQWRIAVSSEGFLETTATETLVFVQACEWPEEIDENRALAAERRAQELLRQKRSIAEYKQTQMALARAMARLRVSKLGPRF